MVTAKTIIIINVVLLAISIIVLSLSSYGLGINRDNQDSPAYQAASSFLSISAVSTVVLIISLIGMILFNVGCIGSSVKLSTVGENGMIHSTEFPMFPQGITQQAAPPQYPQQEFFQQ